MPTDRYLHVIGMNGRQGFLKSLLEKASSSGYIALDGHLDLDEQASSSTIFPFEHITPLRRYRLAHTALWELAKEDCIG